MDANIIRPRFRNPPPAALITRDPVPEDNLPELLLAADMATLCAVMLRISLLGGEVAVTAAIETARQFIRERGGQ